MIDIIVLYACAYQHPSSLINIKKHRTVIDVQTQRGGLDSIIITDNGHGISPSNLPLACTRFATSKLVNVDDLKSIRTFGFRGEALASASMVGRVGIVSRVRPRVKKNDTDATNYAEGGEESSDDEEEDTAQHNNCAYKMQYKDGAPNLQTNPNCKPKPVSSWTNFFDNILSI